MKKYKTQELKPHHNFIFMEIFVMRCKCVSLHKLLPYTVLNEWGVGCY